MIFTHSRMQAEKSCFVVIPDFFKTMLDQGQTLHEEFVDVVVRDKKKGVSGGRVLVKSPVFSILEEPKELADIVVDEVVTSVDDLGEEDDEDDDKCNGLKLTSSRYSDPLLKTILTLVYRS